jgi:hypothetical protein
LTPAAPPVTGTGWACPFCLCVSHNANDERHRYCAACGVFVDDLGSYEVAKQRAEAAVVAAARRVDRSIGMATSLHMTEQRRAVRRLENIVAAKVDA